jgi:hypothetical protein
MDLAEGVNVMGGNVGEDYIHLNIYTQLPEARTIFRSCVIDDVESGAV